MSTLEQKAKTMMSKKYIDFLKMNEIIGWDWKHISDYKYLTTDIIEEHIHEEWDWILLSENEEMELPIDFVRKYIEKPWSWYSLSNRFSIDIISDNSDLPWDWNEISERKDLTFEFVDKHTDKPLDWNALTYKFGFDQSFIEKNPTLPYNWQHLSQTIPLSYILNNPQYPWNWEYVTDNKDITMDFITNNHDKQLNWHEISRFPFDDEYKKIYEEVLENDEIEKAKNVHQKHISSIRDELTEMACHPDNIQFMRQNELIQS